jgi:hypothetical protein
LLQRATGSALYFQKKIATPVALIQVANQGTGRASGTRRL